MADDDKPFPILEACAVFDPTLDRTADLFAAYVSNNPLPAGELPGLIRSVRAALAEDAQVPPARPGSTVADQPETEMPSAAQIKKSITPDALISFLDGKPYKTLRRHLRTHGLTPESYRARFGLPVDYPLVSPNYSAARSELAKAAGLGRGGAAPEAEAGPSAGGAVPTDDSLAA
ncbi:putative transcriptional regulator [Methylorubrum rhodinum]|uniref:Putative transcriptional regulator n=1 Tax=Methylorubrum rhodinum TaxID=29428 RepID=A0A840ZP57_9HYPH|nr:MucR family transcriptional regulator [Methylorubrum rhodinum]MBB5758828.1 putative transcriptional regulator [Methylorubrum rhodinum]